MRAGVVAAGILLLALAGSARAHSLLLESAPAADALLAASPPEISLRFNNRIEKKLSTIRLLDERGGVRPLTMLADGPADRLTATVPSLDPGGLARRVAGPLDGRSRRERALLVPRRAVRHVAGAVTRWRS